MNEHWWQTAAFYEIYVASFQDSDGDGVGDIHGIRRRLDYLQWLGIDALWLTPFYPSPMADFGYDVADYCGVDPRFGSLADIDRLIEEVHERGMRLVVDYVPNHTSDRHPWFVEARRSRASPKRDWYIWRDPAPDGGPPNNWQSQSGGPAWTFDAETGQYWYHAFLPQQPDLNWRNPEVREAMHDVLRFWLERGVDGFRVDVIWHLIKDAQFRDDPTNPEYRPGDPPFRQVIPLYSCDQPEIHDVIKELREVLRGWADRDPVLIGEIYLPLERLMTYYGVDLEGTHLPFNFQLLHTLWRAEALSKLVDSYEEALPAGGWGTWVLGNHDQPRIASKLGPAQARVAMLLLLALRGTPTIYYGDELGMENVAITRPRDPFGLRMPGTGQGRDPQRAPMAWGDGPGCGFTTGAPWLPFWPGCEERSVAAQRAEAASFLSFTRRLLQLRREWSCLRRGDWRPLLIEGETLLFERAWAGERIVAALNLESAPVQLTVPEHVRGRLLVSTHMDRENEEVGETLALRGDEAVLIGRA